VAATDDDMIAPLGRGSLSLGMYRHDGLSPGDGISTLVAEARAIEQAGFDGVTLSEHHLGFRSYFPNPLLTCALLLGRTERIWAGPMPMLLTLRAAALVAEDLAWIAASAPGRVAAGFAAGNRADEHALNGIHDNVAAVFGAGLGAIAEALSADGQGPLDADPAVAAAKGEIPLVSAARSRTAVERAARLGFGLLYSPVSSAEQVARFTALYREAGGAGPRVLIRSVWVDPHGGPSADEQAARARAVADMPGGDWISAGPAAAVTESLADLIQTMDATDVNLRIPMAGVSPELILDQIARLGAGVVPGIAQVLRAKAAQPA